MCQIGEFIYIFGGRIREDFTNKLTKVNIHKLDHMQAEENMPVERAFHCAAQYGRKMVVVILRKCFLVLSQVLLKLSPLPVERSHATRRHRFLRDYLRGLENNKVVQYIYQHVIVRRQQ